MASTSRPIQSVSNTDLYNRWAKVYDTDGNILQATDDYCIPILLTKLFTLTSTNPSAKPLTIAELGAGTGRNTIKLLSPEISPLVSHINALDLSPGMLAIASQRCSTISAAPPSSSINNSNRTMTTGVSMPSIEFYEYDALNPQNFPSVLKLEGQADVVISTLVLEHLPLVRFFETVKWLLKEKVEGYLLLTNMHAEMGRKAQAGFVDEGTGEKVRGLSFVYDVGEVVEVASKFGFEIVGDVMERGVEEGDVGVGKGGLGLGERGKKWIGCKVWFGCLMRLVLDK